MKRILRPIPILTIALLLAGALSWTRHAAGADRRPNILLILADDMGFSDLGCYGSEIGTPNVDGLARRGVRFTQFYNCARCCPTRASLLTGLYPHQAGVGHMLEDWTRFGPAYSPGLNDRCATSAELLHEAGYRTYHLGKWHVGGLSPGQERNFPLARGYDRYYGTGGGGNYFAPKPLFLDRQTVEPGPDYYLTDAVGDYAVRFLEEHAREHAGQPFFIHLCFTAPHFPLHARPADIAKYLGRYRDGWDALRRRRFAREKALGIVDPAWELSLRDPVAKPWVEAGEQEEWDRRMAVYAAMIDCMDRNAGRALDAIRRQGWERNTLVLFLSDNGASAEFLDSWPDPSRGHRPGSVTGTRDSHRCLEVAWANAANTPFREHKMWTHEGGIATPLIASWPARFPADGRLNRQAGHVIDLVPTLLEAAGAKYPAALNGRMLTPLEGRSLMPALKGRSPEGRTLYWEHEGNRAVRQGNWKLVARFHGDWELYNLAADRTELHDRAAEMPARVKELAALWQRWADRVGVVPWERLPGASYRPTRGYRKKSEPPVEMAE
jgi:arylsulfatase A-like enzyme